MWIDYYEKCRDDAPWIFDSLSLIEQAINVNSPAAVFRDLKRKNFNNAHCYSCAPELSVFPGVLLVFVEDPPAGAMAGPVVFWIEWASEDPECPGHPTGWQKDFGEPIWTNP
jgi:hypothetical protein